MSAAATFIESLKRLREEHGADRQEVAEIATEVCANELTYSAVYRVLCAVDEECRRRGVKRRAA